MSPENWVKIIGYVAFGVLIVVRGWRWHLERKVKAERQKLAIKASRDNT
ncbi:hypothetical protein [Aeromonas sp. 62-46]|nr:hypothetical protein [Aeromonas sp. 62-46]